MEVASVDLGLARAVVTMSKDCTDMDMDRVHMAVNRWLVGEWPVVVLPEGATMEVYGIPKASGCGVSLTRKYAMHEVTYSAPTTDELFELIRRDEAGDPEPVEVDAH